ncbi:hypothetical protein LSAT2_027120, partial [Lamellibrachia satsuma]
MSRIAAVIVVTALTVVFASGVSLAATTRANIALVENGYEGILIAIAETVPHSTELIGRIKMSSKFEGNTCDRDRVRMSRSNK